MCHNVFRLFSYYILYGGSEVLTVMFWTGLVSEGLFKAWITLAEELGDGDEGERASEMGCSKYPASLHLQQRRAALLVALLSQYAVYAPPLTSRRLIP